MILIKSFLLLSDFFTIQGLGWEGIWRSSNPLESPQISLRKNTLVKLRVFNVGINKRICMICRDYQVPIRVSNKLLEIFRDSK
jgi:hypothetical protein